MSARLSPAWPPSSRTWLVLILAVAVLARLTLLLALAPSLSLQTSGYDTYAVHLQQGRGYAGLHHGTLDSDLPPLYPFFLAGVYAVFGRHHVAVAVVQTGLELLSTLLVCSIGRRLGGAGTGLWAAGLYACYPYLAFQNVTVNDTAIFILLLVLSVRVAYVTGDGGGWRPAAAVGAALGAASLTKPFAPLLLPLFAVWWWRRLGARDTARLTLISATALVAVIAPWVIRNTRLHGEFVLVSTNGGSNLHAGNNSCVADYLSRGWDPQWVTCLAAPPSGLREAERDRWHRQQAVRYLRDHPQGLLHLFSIKLRTLWNPTITPSALPPTADLGDNAVLLYHTPRFQAARVVHAIYFAPLLALAVVGFVLAWRHGLPIGPVASVPIVITIVYVIFHPSTRYRSPADPFVFMFAAYALAWLRERTRTCAPAS